MNVTLIKFRLLHHSLLLPCLALVLIIIGPLVGIIGRKRGSKKANVFTWGCLIFGWCLILVYLVANDGLGSALLRIGGCCLMYILVALLFRHLFARKK